MREDDTGQGGRLPPESSAPESRTPESAEPERDPDEFLRQWLEDDSPWSTVEDYLRERRVDRHRRYAHGRRPPRRWEMPKVRRKGRSRAVAVTVLIVAAVVVAVIGLQADESLPGAAGAKDAVPFSLLPISGGPTSTTIGSTTTSASTTSTEPAPTSTTPTPITLG